jgi:hypothetical protein
VGKEHDEKNGTKQRRVRKRRMVFLIRIIRELLFVLGKFLQQRVFRRRR